MAQYGRGDVKKILYDTFKGKIDTDIIDIVFANCSYNGEEAATALSTICQSPEQGVQFPEKKVQKPNPYHDDERDPIRRKTMFLLRGLPGSGKTHLAKTLMGPNDALLSTDDYFVNGARFNFRGNQLQNAHEWNLGRARDAMRSESQNNIFIDNTNTRCWEMVPYAAAAKQHGYSVEILIPNTPWAWNLGELEWRNTHGVPKNTLLKMFERFERNVKVEDLLQNSKQLQSHRTNDLGIPDALTDSSQRSSSMPSLETVGGKSSSSLLERPSQKDYKKEISSSEDLLGSRISSSANFSSSRLSCDMNRPNNSSTVSFGEEFMLNDIMSGSCTESKAGSLRDIINVDSDEEFAILVDKVGHNETKNIESISMNQEDLKFLQECFPSYSSGILQSVYSRFEGDMQRVCNEIMTQPLIRGRLLDDCDTGYNDGDQFGLKGQEMEVDSDDHMNEIESGPNTSRFYAAVSAVNDDKEVDNAQFFIKIDRRFLAELKRRLKDRITLSFEDVGDEELEFPIEDYIAEEIFCHWENHFKAGRKRFVNRKTEKGNKQTTVKELKNPTKTKPKNLGKKSNWQGKAGKSSGGTSSNIVHKDQGKLQGCFRPWSAVASGPSKDFKSKGPEMPKWDLSIGKLNTRLYTMFPTVEKDVLNEVLAAMSNDIDEAIKVVRASLSCAPKGGSAVGDLDPSPMVHENEQDKLTMKCGGMTNIEEKSLANPKMACSLGDSKSVDVIDITDNTHPGYQSLHGTSYADYRAEAQAHAELRTDLLRKAAKAYTEKQGHVASFYAEAARKQGNLMKEAHSRAAGLIFLNKNSSRENPASFDFHGLHCKEAVEMLEELLLQAENHDLKYIDVVTGRGVHSKQKIARLRSSVLNYLKGNQYRYSKLNDGCFRVHLK